MNAHAARRAWFIAWVCGFAAGLLVGVYIAPLLHGLQP